MSHGADHWDQRYGASDDGPGTPDPVVVAVLDQLAPGRALDLACGRGRHARWLAARGWAVTAVDFSAVAIARAQDLEAQDRDNEATARHIRPAVASLHAKPAGTPISWVVADVLTWTPEPDPEPGPGPEPAYDLVLCAFVHLIPPDFARIRAWLAPRGRLVVVSHAPGAPDGPRNPAYRYDEDQLRVAATGLQIQRLAGSDGRIVLVARQGP